MLPEISVSLQDSTRSATSTIRAGERARHAVLSFRLTKRYFVYCGLCALLALTTFVLLVCSYVELRRAGVTVSERRLKVWGEVLEVVVGLAMCIETAITWWLVGTRSFFRDFWLLLDFTVAFLTGISWVLALTKNALHGKSFEEMDMVILGIRFVVQPCRIVTAASMARRAIRMQRSDLEIRDVNFDDVQESNDPESNS
eukprot:gnl/MRDRNA2_/MRDRNA2_268210_c0_seq1.p1 gnl/MRDRNA2_/MRDRNA2_268210_c0~~gnl/MRDRNA2_/MRDRNA2_268210_c0_seq1.p1  ORF type:complete len:199 (-),score=27.48 gnl/MRDRNA2_/MRDRNA2_268210_c0_seq1:92-688(-)